MRFWQRRLLSPGGLLSPDKAEAGGGGPTLGQDRYAQDQYAQGEYSQDQYAQGQYAQGQYAQGQYAQGQYTQDQYSQGQFAIDQFYDALAPFGDWVDHPGHGYVWLPRTVGPDWRPFTVGNWLHTEDYGWYWQSYEPFAWAVYHYGRWGFDPEYGWYWVPGDTWAPAWVQWRYGSEYVGWAPEAPIPHGGYAYGGVESYAPAPAQDAWVFVEPRYLASPAVRSYALPRTSISIAFSRTTYVNRPVYRDGYVYNYGMPRRHWSKVTGKYLEPRRLHRGHHKARPKGWKGRGHRDVYVYAPRVKKGVRPHRPPKKIAHKPPRKKAYSANRNRAARTVPPRPLGPRGVMNPDYRRPAAGSGRHPLARYDALGPRKAPHARPAATKPQHAKPKHAKSNAARSKPNTSKGAKNRSVKSGSAKNGEAKNGEAKNGRPRTGRQRKARPRQSLRETHRAPAPWAWHQPARDLALNSKAIAGRLPTRRILCQSRQRLRVRRQSQRRRRALQKAQGRNRRAQEPANRNRPADRNRLDLRLRGPSRRGPSRRGPSRRGLSRRRQVGSRQVGSRQVGSRQDSNAKQGGAKSGARRQGNGQGRNGGKGRGHDGGKRG